jgi:hypothetical protein
MAWAIQPGGRVENAQRLALQLDDRRLIPKVPQEALQPFGLIVDADTLQIHRTPLAKHRFIGHR